MKELQLVVHAQLSAHKATTVRNQAEKCQQTTPPERSNQAPKLPLQVPGREIAVQTSAWRRERNPVSNRQTPSQPKPIPKRKTGDGTAALNQKPRQQNLSQPLTLPAEEDGAPGNRARQKWTEVKGKHARRKAARRPDAIIVKCSEATPYSEVLKTVKAAPNLQSLKDSVKTIRKSASGELILRLHRNSDPATEQLHTALSAVFLGKAEVKAMQETVDVEILDIDETTTAEEVLTALFASLESDIPARATPHMRKAYGGTQVATLALQPGIANKVLESGKVRIGWVVCRIRRKIDPKRCFRCMGFGHTSSRASQDLLSQTVREERIDVAILSEPYVRKHEGQWQQSTDGKAAIWSCGQPPCQLTQRLSRNGYVRAKCVCLLNTGNKSTYSKAGRESIIDLTFASPLLARCSKWCVSDLYTHSDHLAVLTTVTTTSDRPAGVIQHVSFKTDSLDRDCLLRMVDGLCVRGDANGSAEAIAGTIIEACNVSMTTVRRGGNHHRPVVWWNADIAKARRECHAARRRCQRARSSPMYDLYASQFKMKRKELKDAIKASKARHFQELCDAADLEPFGAAYKLVMKKLCRQPMPTCPRQLGQIVHALFPHQPNVEYPASLYLRNNTAVLNNTNVLTDIAEVLSITAKAYLFRFKHALDPYCELCGEGVLEDAEHAFFHCPLFARERELAAGDNARITPDNIVATMLSSPFGWAAISKMASIIMKELRRRERSRREVNQPSD
ncbi:hypothetical protein ACLKA7_001772 [Drosophila subpalustris]